MRNESNWDRAIRALLGLGLLSLVVIGPRTFWGLLGFIPLLTGILSALPRVRVEHPGVASLIPR